MEIDLPWNFTPRLYQRPLWNHFAADYPGQRGIAVWHRRAGKDVIATNLICLKAHQRIGTYWHMLPTYKQARKVVWNNRTKEGRRFLDFFPPQLVDRKQEQEMRIHFRNGSILELVGTDDIDRLVGANPVGCVFSEYALHDPRAFQLIEPILVENGGWALFISTVRGKNHYYDLWKGNKDNPEWFTDVRDVTQTERDDGTAVISEEEIERIRKSGTPEEIIQQEYYLNWNAALRGSVFGAQMDKMLYDKRLRHVSWEPRIPVDTFWDIGHSDSTAIIFMQQAQQEVRIIDFYEATREPLAHFVKHLREKEYVYGNHWGPWDMMVKTLAADGQSVREKARKLGVNFKLVNQHLVADSIDNARSVMPAVWIDQRKCDRLIEALRSYRYEWDEVKKVPGSKPVHDWASHPADAFRYMAWALKRNMRRGQKPQDTAIDEYAYT